MTEALDAIDLLESQGVPILGWEGWIKDPEGRVGRGSAPQGTVSLQDLSLSAAAQVCRETIQHDAARWAEENLRTADELHFCITVRA